MSARRRILLLVGVIGVLGVTAAAALAATVSWGTAIEVPGSQSLNVGNSAGVTAISCPAAGSCTAGGFYNDGQGGSGLHPFVVDEKNGSWGTAIEVPGEAALNGDRDGAMTTLSCPAGGWCAGGGYVTNNTGNTHAFLANETKGVWGNAREVPGLTALDGGSLSQTNSISCSSEGNCVAGGFYYANGFHAWVATQKNGGWHKAIEVPGTQALIGNNIGSAEVISVSCGSDGYCAAGGDYTTDHMRAWIASERNGVWKNAIQVPGLAALNAGGHAQVTAISCISTTFCGAGGFYTDAKSNNQVFVVSSNKNGVWAKARVLPGTPAATKTDGFAGLYSLSCASAGYCSAGGYETASDGQQAFVASSKAGTWSNAIEVPSIGALDNKTDSAVFSISCATASNCAATGYYDAVPRVFVVREKNGVWGHAVTLPGIDNLGYGTGTPNPISCAPAGRCAVGGQYYNGTSAQAYVTAP